MTEVKIFEIYSQFLGEFTAYFKDSYSLAYSPMCQSSIRENLFYNIRRQILTFGDLKTIPALHWVDKKPFIENTRILPIHSSPII